MIEKVNKFFFSLTQVIVVKLKNDFDCHMKKCSMSLIVSLFDSFSLDNFKI